MDKELKILDFKELEEKLEGESLSLEELIAIIEHKAFADIEEKNIFWAEYIDRLVDIAYQKAKKIMPK